MSPRSLSLIALCFLATPALAGERLLVAGTDGSVYQANPNVKPGVFEYFACACTGPVKALAADRTNLYVADEFGQLLVSDVNTGIPKSLFALGLLDITSLAATPSGLFVGTESGVIQRVDPATGDVLGERLAPAAVRALASFRGNLFAATSDSAIYAAPYESGEFTYFSCFCFFDLQELVVSGNRLLAGDGSGLVITIDANNGMLLNAHWTAPMNAMAVSSGDFLVHGGGGVIGRFDGDDATPLGKLASPFDVSAMIVVRDRPTPTLTTKVPKQQ